MILEQVVSGLLIRLLESFNRSYAIPHQNVGGFEDKIARESCELTRGCSDVVQFRPEIGDKKKLLRRQNWRNPRGLLKASISAAESFEVPLETGRIEAARRGSSFRR